MVCYSITAEQEVQYIAVINIAEANRLCHTRHDQRPTVPFDTLRDDVEAHRATSTSSNSICRCWKISLKKLNRSLQVFG